MHIHVHTHTLSRACARALSNTHPHKITMTITLVHSLVHSITLEQRRGGQRSTSLIWFWKLCNKPFNRWWTCIDVLCLYLLDVIVFTHFHRHVTPDTGTINVSLRDMQKRYLSMGVERGNTVRMKAAVVLSWNVKAIKLALRQVWAYATLSGRPQINKPETIPITIDNSMLQAFISWRPLAHLILDVCFYLRFFNTGSGNTWGANPQIILRWLNSGQNQAWLIRVTVYTCQRHIMTLITPRTQIVNGVW